jgi:zinc/manganese transport system substrate-binding protein
MLPLLLAFALQKPEPLDLVVTIPDLADLTRIIGGDAVRVEVLVPFGADPHAVLPKASLLLKLQRADGLVLMGLDYEHAFLPALLEKVRSDAIQPNAPGWCCLADKISALEVPTTLDRGQGADLHPRGNPHFNLDPENGRIMAASIRDLLIRLAPDRQTEFQERWQAWDADAQKRIAAWTLRLAPLKGKPIATYHRSWTYFTTRFGLEVVGLVEPKPGLPPDAAHLVNLKRTLTEKKVRVLLMEPWYSERQLGRLLEGTEVRLVKVGTCCGCVRPEESYLDFLGSVVEEIARAYDLPPVQSPP